MRRRRRAGNGDRGGRRTDRGHQAQRSRVPGQRMRRGAVSARPGRLSAGPDAGRVRVLSVGRVRRGRGGRVQRGRPAVRQQPGMRQDGKNDIDVTVAKPYPFPAAVIVSDDLGCLSILNDLFFFLQLFLTVFIVSCCLPDYLKAIRTLNY